MKNLICLLILIISFSFINPSYQIAVLKYRGGGDWYANPSSLKNLIVFANESIATNIDPNYATVEVGDISIFNYPFVHMTGHGNVVFSQQEADNLRRYLIGGGFLHIDDNYGMDPFIRPEMKKVFPELDWIELPFSHPIYEQKFSFKNGLPKIHEHEGRSPQGFGLIFEGRLVCFYSFECDLSDGSEDQEIHNNSDYTRTKALQMGANLLQYVFIGKK